VKSWIHRRERRERREKSQDDFKIPSPLTGEGVKKLEFALSPYPLSAGERVNPLKLIINFLPLDGGGAGWG